MTERSFSRRPSKPTWVPASRHYSASRSIPRRSRERITVKAEITADDGSPVTGNAYSFDVFTAAQLAVPKQRIAVLDPSNSLKPFLKQAGIAFVEFDATTDRSLPVFVSRTEAKTPEQRKLFAELDSVYQGRRNRRLSARRRPERQVGRGRKSIAFAARQRPLKTSRRHLDRHPAPREGSSDIRRPPGQRHDGADLRKRLGREHAPGCRRGNDRRGHRLRLVP